MILDLAILVTEHLKYLFLFNKTHGMNRSFLNKSINISVINFYICSLNKHFLLRKSKLYFCGLVLATLNILAFKTLQPNQWQN